MTNDKRRRPSSANPTSRPRRIAGRSGATPEPPEPPVPAAPEELDDERQEEMPAPEDAPETASQDHEPPAPESTVDAEPEPEPEPEPDKAAESQRSVTLGGFVESARTTRTLLVLVVVLALASLAGGIFLWVHDDDDDSSFASDTGPVIAADDETPVRITGEDARLAVAAAAQAAYTIVATNWEDYDAQVDEAAELMTPAFAEEYRQTAEDVADAIVASKTEVQVTVVAQGVVRADQQRVQALVFLNQYVTKDDQQAVYTPYRALVTVDNTDQGWLVSDLDTK